MRTVLALLLAATLAVAEDDAELSRTVDALVRELAAPTAETRTLARFRLASYGDRVRPLLERVESNDPEVRRAIRQLTRTAGKVEIEMLPRADTPLPIGAPLVLEVRILNNTEQTLWLLPNAARQGEAGPFRIRLGGRMLPPVGIDQVNWGNDGMANILPGGTRRFRLTLGGAASPLRRPALYDVSVVFDGLVARGYGAPSQELAILDDALEQFQLVRETAPVRIHVVGRKADELEQALGSDDPKEREVAAREISTRDDDAVVPILRRHARELPLRVAAVRRLAAIGAEEDFDLVLEATTDDNADVRRAAVLGLGRYRNMKAHLRLMRLTSDAELQAEAIRALKGHKHVATVERYVKLLGATGCDPGSVAFIRATLLEWTGISVSPRASEIAAFKGWWEENRVRWAEENASDK